MKQVKTIITHLLTALFLASFISSAAWAFCLLPSSSCPQTATGWTGNAATFNSNGFAGSNASFDAAFAVAASRWNNLANFTYSTTAASVDPCDTDHSAATSTHGWAFAANKCGTAFGASTLAVATTWSSSFTPSVTGINDSDINFNTAKTWDVHSGAGASNDFRRVATHELGHSAGIGHDNTFAALMNTIYSDTIEIPQFDDINGLQAIYGALSNGALSTFSTNATGPQNTIKITNVSGSATASILVQAFDAAGGSVVRSGFALPLPASVAANGTVSIPGSDLTANYPGAVRFKFQVGSSQIVASNIKRTPTGVNVTVFRNIDFYSTNSTGPLNTLKISNEATTAATMSVSSFESDGTPALASVAASSLPSLVPAYGTILLNGSDLIASYPTGVRFDFTINSTNAFVTDVKKTSTGATVTTFRIGAVTEGAL